LRLSVQVTSLPALASEKNVILIADNQIASFSSQDEREGVKKAQEEAKGHHSGVIVQANRGPQHHVSEGDEGY